MYICSGGSRISRRRGRQPRKGGGGRQFPTRLHIEFFYVKTKESEPLGVGAHRLRPPLGSVNDMDKQAALRCYYTLTKILLVK